MPIIDVARRGAKAARQVLGVREGHADAVAPEAEPRTADVQIRRLRRKLRVSKAEVSRLSQELKVTRASVRDPDPTIQLPTELYDLIDRVHQEKLTYLQPANLRALARIAVGLESAGTPGILIEAGAARGGSAIVMAAAKAAERPMKVYDVFGMIPPPSERDGQDVHRRYEVIMRGESSGIGGDTYYGYRDDLYAEVEQSFTRFGLEVKAHRVSLIRGLFQETLTLDEPVAFAHLDGDWYESTLVCLERIAPLLVPGGRIVLDDYYAWSGCRTAVDEYFSGRPGYHVERRAKVHVVRL